MIVKKAFMEREVSWNNCTTRPWLYWMNCSIRFPSNLRRYNKALVIITAAQKKAGFPCGRVWYSFRPNQLCPTEIPYWVKNYVTIL